MMWLGPKVKAGVNPVSRDEMYMFVTEDRPNNDRIDPSRFLRLLRESHRALHGAANAVRQGAARKRFA